MFQTTTVPPNITQRPDPEMFDRMVGDTLSLPCVAEGFPPPDVLWTHNGSKLENCTLDRLNRREVCAEFPRGGDRGSSSVLTLSVEGSNAGLYTCMANNSAGMAVYQVFISVENATSEQRSLSLSHEVI